MKREVFSYIMTIDRKTKIFKLKTLFKDVGIRTNTTSQVLDKAIEISTKVVLEDKDRMNQRYREIVHEEARK